MTSIYRLTGWTTS